MSSDTSARDRRRASGVLRRLLQGLPGNRRPRLGHHRQVVVRAHSERDAPVAHRALRIELCRFRERARRLVVVERPEKPHSLIEISLRRRRIGADRAVEVAQSVEHPSALGPLRQGQRQPARSMGLGRAEKRLVGRRGITIRADARQTKRRHQCATKDPLHAAHGSLRSGRNPLHRYPSTPTIARMAHRAPVLATRFWYRRYIPAA